MELKELEHFLAVVQHGGFSKAASNIYVSQPTLSKSIKKLEASLGVTLFERSTRKLVLTDAGELVYNQAMKIISATNELQEALDDLLNIPSGEIKIGVPPLIGTLFFPTIAKKFASVHPNVSLTLYEHGAKRIEYLVEDGKIDLGIVVMPVDQKKFSITPFVKEEFMFFSHVDHPFAKRASIHIRDLVNESFILFNEEFALHHLIIHQCKTKGGFMPQIAYESSQWDLITELISEKIGITLFPKSIFQKMDPSVMTTVPLEDPPMWELGVITKKERYLSFAVRALLRFIEEEFTAKITA